MVLFTRSKTNSVSVRAKVKIFAIKMRSACTSKNMLKLISLNCMFLKNNAQFETLKTRKKGKIKNIYCGSLVSSFLGTHSY